MDDSEMLPLVDAAMTRFRGDSAELESAIGALLIGRKFGWRVLYLIHSRVTIRKYEKILGHEFKELLPETGPLSRKSMAWVAVDKLGNYWKAVKGEVRGVRSSQFKAKP